MNDNSNLSAQAAIRSYMAEMHNDGLYFLEQGNQAADAFVKRRFLRAAIIYFCTSVEAAMSKLVHNHLLQFNHLSPEDAILKEKLTDPDSIPPVSFRSIEGKISVIERLFNTSFSEEIKANYIKLTHLRNNIIHYSTSYQNSIYDSGEVERAANESPQILDAFLSELFGFVGLFNGFQKNRTPRY